MFLRKVSYCTLVLVALALALLMLFHLTTFVYGQVIGPGADLREADLRRSILSGADLSGANLSGARLSDANLTNANLRGANLGFDLPWFSSASLSGAILSETNLEGANLSEANLRRREYAEITMFDANLTGANLTKAVYTGKADGREGTRFPNGFDPQAAGMFLLAPDADLSGAGLRGANLAEVNLTKANLVGADLGGANLEGADLSEVMYDEATTFPDGFDPVAESLLFFLDNMVSAIYIRSPQFGLCRLDQ